jgi:hypothetical protein
MGKYKWNLGLGGFCGIVVVLKKISRRFKWKRNAALQ